MKDKSFTRKFVPAAQSLQVTKKGMDMNMMKKGLTMVLSVLMVAALFIGCSNKNDDSANSTPEVTKAPITEEVPTEVPTEAPAELPTEAPVPVVTVAADTKFNAFEQFDMESATGTNVPWIYSFTSDKGVTFDPLTIMEASGGLSPWHPWGGSWIGVGLNNDVPNLVELNTDMKDGMNGALGFVAPADGSYVLTGYVTNPWDQTADLLYCRLNGTDVFTVQPGMAADGAVAFPQTTMDLKAGDIVYFFCPSTTADGWVSAYVEVNFYYEPTTVPELVLPEPSAASEAN